MLITCCVPEVPTRNASWLLGLSQEPHELALNHLVAGDHVTGHIRRFAALEISAIAAGFAHDDEAGRDIPGPEIALPIGVKAPRRHPGEVERRRPETAQPR